MNHASRCLILALSAALAGCVSQGPFPSLAPRPAEREDWSEEPVRAALTVADDPRIRTRLADLLASAREGEAAFEADLVPAERAVSRGGAEGSDSWIEAQEEISRLEAARSQTTGALAELHQLGLERAGEPTSAADLAAINAAIAEVEALAARQQQRLAAVSRR